MYIVFECRDSVIDFYGVFTKKEDAEKQQLIKQKERGECIDIEEVEADEKLPDIEIREKIIIEVVAKNFNNFRVSITKELFDINQQIFGWSQVKSPSKIIAWTFGGMSSIEHVLADIQRELKKNP